MQVLQIVEALLKQSDLLKGRCFSELPRSSMAALFLMELCAKVAANSKPGTIVRCCLAAILRPLLCPAQSAVPPKTLFFVSQSMKGELSAGCRCRRAAGCRMSAPPGELPSAGLPPASCSCAPPALLNSAF